MIRLVLGVVMGVLALLLFLISDMDLSPDGVLTLDTLFGSVSLVAFGSMSWMAGPISAVEALDTGATERWLAAIALAAGSGVLIGLNGRKVSPFITEEAGQEVAVYDPLLAGLPRRRITDRGRPSIVFGLSVIGVFFGGMMLWSAVAPVESAAVAPARVRVETNRRILDHPDGGTVASLAVKEGDKVSRGQVLLSLDRTEAEAELAVLSRRRDALLTLQARLLAEQGQSNRVVYPEDLIERARQDDQLRQMVDGQDALFDAANKAFRGEMEVGERRILQLQERVDGLEAQLDSVRSQLQIIAEERADLEGLLAKGLTPQTRVLSLRREEARLKGSVGSLIADVAQTKTRIGETRLSIIQLARNRLAETSERLRETFVELLELEPRIGALRTRLARADLKAPENGVVFGLTKFTVGGVVRPGEPILEIVPKGSDLVVEAQIKPVDRDVITVGMAARVRLTAFSVRQNEPVEGELIRVSADTKIDETTRESFYTGIIRISEDALAAQGLELEPGMPAEVVIPLAARTPLQYLLEPLARNWEFALREE